MFFVYRSKKVFTEALMEGVQPQATENFQFEYQAVQNLSALFAVFLSSVLNSRNEVDYSTKEQSPFCRVLSYEFLKEQVKIINLKNHEFEKRCM